MKTYLLSLAVLMVCFSGVGAQSAPPLEEQLNTLWKQKNYPELQKLIDAKTSANPPDILALYCAKFCHNFVQPDKAKAMAALRKLKTIAEATKDKDFISFADLELAGVIAIPEAEFTRNSPEILASMHTHFANYPGIEFGITYRNKFPKP